MAWSGQTHLIQKQAGVQESSGPSFWQEATSPLSVSDFQTRFHSSTDVLDNNVENQPESDLILADCVMFRPNGSGPEEGIVQESSGPFLANASQWIQTRCKSDPACLLG